MKKEYNNKSTSAKIKTVKKCSKKILLILTNELAPFSPGFKTLNTQLVSEYMARIKNTGTKKVAIIFLIAMNRFIDTCCDGFNIGSAYCFLL